MTVQRKPGQHLGPQRLWTPDEFTRLLRMVEAGYTRPKMAQLLGRHESSVTGKLARHGIRLSDRRKFKRTRRLQLMLTEEEHATLKRQAGTYPVYAYVRTLLFGKQVRERERTAAPASDS